MIITVSEGQQQEHNKLDKLIASTSTSLAARATNKVGTIGARLTLFDVGSKVAKNGDDLGRRPL